MLKSAITKTGVVLTVSGCLLLYQLVRLKLRTDPNSLFYWESFYIEGFKYSLVLIFGLAFIVLGQTMKNRK